jgi:hypothetical protein
MASFKLIPYWIEVREIEEPNTSWNQTNIHVNEPEFPDDNLADYFHKFIENLKNDVHIDQDSQKTFTVGTPIKRSGNTIEGRFKSGEWGRNADFWDIDQHERIEDAREENHAEEIPYYFLFHIPNEDNSQALLILSKYRKKGINTLFSSLFKPRERDIDVGDAYMTIEPHYSDEVAKRIDEADKMDSVRFKGKDTIPAREQYADRNDIQRVNDDISGQIDVGSELKMTPQGNDRSFREYVKGLIPSRDEKKNFDYGRITEQNFSNASVTVVEGESQLTFSLWKEQIQMRMDVDPEEHNLDVHGGHPTPYSLGGVARQLANDLTRDNNSNFDTESLIPRNVGMPDDMRTEPSEQGQ